MSTVVYRRPARTNPPELPRGEIPLQAPPQLPTARRDWTYVLYSLPMLAGVAAMALMYTGTGSRGPVTYVVSGLFGVSMLGMMGMGFGRLAGNRSTVNDERRDYLRYLGQVRTDVEATAAAQREAASWQHPAPDGLWSLVSADRLWERRGADPDFAVLRVGLGVQPLATPLVPPDTVPVEDLEPLCAVALRRFVQTHAKVPELPIAVALRSYSRVTASGERDGALGLAYAMLAQLATLHTPDDVRIWVCASADRRPDWEWVKWLPHNQHPSIVDAVGTVRMVSDRLADLEALAAADLAERPRFTPGGRLAADRPHIMVVLDGVPLGGESQLTDRDAVLGVTLLDIADEPAGRPMYEQDRYRLRLHVTDGQLAVLRRAGSEHLGAADHLRASQVEALARQLTRFRAGAAVDEEAPLTTDLGLTDLLGIGDPAAVDPARTWRGRADRDRLRIPIGVDEQGLPIDLDLKESAQEGMGPHGLLIGATGSGKSELLRTLVTGLALTHSSETLNFVLVDFKGGATFAGLAELPHTAAVITNLADDLALVDRMKDAVQGELNRRQELLRDAGNFASVRDYERAREAGADLPPVPSLLIVCDEFSELLSARPDFIDLFVSIGRLGRSLAIHLLLASQRLEEGRLRGLESHLSYRIALRCFSAVESRIVLGNPAAYELPPIPGSGYLKFDTGTLIRFKAAYVSGPYRPHDVSIPEPPSADRRILPFTTAPVRASDAPVQPEKGSGATTLSETHLSVIVGLLAGRGPAAHRVWLPPLHRPPTVDRLLALATDEAGADGLAAEDGSAAPRGFAVPVAIEDRPLEQRQALLWADLAAGHVAIVGGPQSGKSTLARTFIATVARTHSPREVQFYCLDFGGGTLMTVGDLPHVGSVAGRLDLELVRRTLAELRTLLIDRERLFQEHGVDSMATYRRLRRDGSVGTDRHGDVVLVIDGWQSFRSEFEAMEQATIEQIVVDLATRGTGFGIHLILTATRWLDLRMTLRDLFANRFELRLGDPTESVFDRKMAAQVPGGHPGRGLSPQRLHFYAALPRIDGVDRAEDLAAGTRALVEEAAAAWPGSCAPPIRLLPRSLPVDDVPAPPPDTHRIAIGIREADLGPVHLDFAADPHFLCFGDVESGRTNLLRVMLHNLTRQYPPERVQIAVVDYRRGLLGLVDDAYLFGYASASTALRPLVAQLVEAVRVRLPGPEISAQELRARSWWTGPELFVVVDDHDLVVTPTDNPLLPLLDLLPQARDTGLHVVLARPTANAQRALFEPVVGRLRELGSPGVILSGDRAEGALLGSVRPTQLPPGRGQLVSRRTGQELIQVAWLPPPED